MSQCGKCVAKITNVQESIVCVDCKLYYHITCVNIRSAKLQTIKNAWKCEMGSDEFRLSDTSEEPGVSIVTILQGIEGLRKDMALQFGGVNSNPSDVKTQLSVVSETVTGMKTQLDTLARENEVRNNEHKELKKENKELKTGVILLRSQFKELEQYSSKDNVEIVGVPFTKKKENIFFVLDSIARVLHVPLNETVVSIAHRLPDYKENGIPNIIVKFVTRYAARSSTNLTANDLNTSWQKTNIFVNDHLTPTNQAPKPIKGQEDI